MGKVAVVKSSDSKHPKAIGSNRQKNAVESNRVKKG
jgi:hypothetical protein